MPNRAEVKRVLIWAAKKFPQSKVTPETCDNYAEELEALDPARLELAFKALIAKSEFWPSLAAVFAAEKGVVTEIDKTRAFRRVELALIALNDELKGDVITLGEYQEKRAQLLKESWITEDMLKMAQVYKPGKDGNCPEPNTTWAELEERRQRSALQAAAKEPVALPSIMTAYQDELRRLAAMHGLPEPYWPKVAPKPAARPDRPKVPPQSVEDIRAALSKSLTPNPKLPEDIQRWMQEEGR